MSCYIRKVAGDESTNYLLLAKDDWDLRIQFKIFEEWLSDADGSLEGADYWIADIGFNHRADASGGGPVISTDLMQLCVRNNMNIYISEY